MMEVTRAAWEVTAGVIPNMPEPEHTRRFFLSEAEWDRGNKDGKGVDRFMALQGEAMVYALSLQHPNHLNWVRLEWIWF